MPVWGIKKGSNIKIVSYNKYDIWQTHVSTKDLEVTEKNFNGYGRGPFKTISGVLEYIDGVDNDGTVIWNIGEWRIEIAVKYMEQLG